MKSITITSIALVVGIALGIGAQSLLSGSSTPASAEQASSDPNQPLYWVAPMDPNYKRDKPGKSPMGMDLVPVYAKDLAGGNEKAGTVTISPAVENNLGVKTTAAVQSRLALTLDTVGYVGFDKSKLWQINVRVSGWVEKLWVNAAGEKVTKGQVLFSLYSPELVKAQEELLNAYQTRSQGLIRGATERLSALGVDKKQIAAIVKANKASTLIDIKAPADGVIATLAIREGGYLSPAQTVISGGSLDDVWVEAEIFERQSDWIKIGTAATIKLEALPNQVWEGKVDYIYPILDPKSRTLKVRIRFKNPDVALKPNMFANISFQPVSDTDVIVIPSSVVIYSRGMARVVLALGEGKFRSARIEVGRQANNQIEVLQGLKAGDKIVTSAQFMLDSESNRTADLERINGTDAISDTQWTSGEITKVMANHRMLTINHQPVPAWKWPGMVMDFTLAPALKLNGLSAGQQIEFAIKKTESGQYEIVDYRQSTKKAVNQVWAKGKINMLMADFQMLTLAHEAIAAWNWPAGEMTFSTAPNLDLSGLAQGQEVEFLVTKQGTDYQITEIKTVQGGGQ